MRAPKRDITTKHLLLHTAGFGYDFVLRIWLNTGAAGPADPPPETVEFASRNPLGDLKVKMLPGVIPSLSNDAEFFPGESESWALTFMVNEDQTPTGRPAGSLTLAGLANLYYWIDRQHGIGGFWGTQIFRFADPTSVGGYLDFETATNRAPGR